jgi:hypothetical protein
MSSYVMSSYVYIRLILLTPHAGKNSVLAFVSVLFSPWSAICAHGYKYSLMFETVGLKFSRDTDFEYKRKIFI